MNLKKLYIFTGKGGVGKTALSLAFCKYLQSQNKKVLLVYYKGSSIQSGKAPQKPEALEEMAQKLGVPLKGLDLIESAQEYVGRKLKSETMAKWVIKTPFFKALINMIPGFSYVIYLGRTLEFLKRDPELTIVIDSPSSGHAVTMLEATHNFSEIFSSGLLFEDTQKMIDTMFKENFMQINIVTLPTLMAVNEAIELRATLTEIAPMATKIICNNSFLQMEGIDQMETPGFLQEKISNEEKVINTLGSQISTFIGHVPSVNMQTVAEEIVPSMKNLI